MKENEIKNLNEKCRHIRSLIIEEIGELGVGHVGGSLSIVEALVVLYNKVMNINPSNPYLEGRDRFVLSKGHGGPGLYAVLADRGFFDIEELSTLNKPNTNLPSHCDMNKTKGVDMTVGSLGQGISCAVGMAKASKIKKDNAYIYCILGDGECQEGEVWEASMCAAHFKLNNLIAFIDYNKMQIDGLTKDVMSLGNIHRKWEAFGWNVLDVDGHNVVDIYEKIMAGKKSKDKPTIIILNTIKGKGISFIEEMGYKNHSMNVTKTQKALALNELRGEE